MAAAQPSGVTGHVQVRDVQATACAPSLGRTRSERSDPPGHPTGQQIALPARWKYRPSVPPQDDPTTVPGGSPGAVAVREVRRPWASFNSR